MVTMSLNTGPAIVARPLFTLPIRSFGGRLGQPPRCHSLLGEATKARVQDSSDNGADDWSCEVQPGVVEFASRNHRAKCSRRVKGGARKRTSHQNVEGQRHSDRERREIARSPGDGRAEYDGDQEEGEHGLN